MARVGRNPPSRRVPSRGCSTPSPLRRLLRPRTRPARLRGLARTGRVPVLGDDVPLSTAPPPGSRDHAAQCDRCGPRRRRPRDWPRCRAGTTCGWSAWPLWRSSPPICSRAAAAYPDDRRCCDQYWSPRERRWWPQPHPHALSRPSWRPLHRSPGHSAVRRGFAMLTGRALRRSRVPAVVLGDDGTCGPPVPGRFRVADTEAGSLCRWRVQRRARARVPWATRVPVGHLLGHGRIRRARSAAQSRASQDVLASDPTERVGEA